MINIDKDYLITVDLKNTKVKSDKTIFFYNTDLNICNIFIKLICTDEDKAIPDDLIVEFAVLKPETDEFKPLDATLISKEDLLYQVDLTTDYFDIVGKYSCEIRVSGTIENELKCFTSEEFDYVVKPNITAKLDKKIKNDKNLPVLEKLIKDVKEITDGINKNEIQMKRDENLVGDNKTVVGAINQLREDVNSGIGGGTVELKDYQKKNDEFLNTDEKTITGGINEVNNKINKVQENQIELDKDDVSFDGIDDISHDTLTTTNKKIIPAINEVNDKFKDIVKKVENAGQPTDTQITNAVNSYLENNPITLDDLWTDVVDGEIYEVQTPPKQIDISVQFIQGSTTIYANTTLDSLKSMLIVNKVFDDESTEKTNDYTLSGILTVGNSVITVTSGTYTKTFNVIVSEKPKATLTGITTTYSQGSKIIYPSTSLNDLKSDLVVTATYSDNTTATVNDYTLSGTLTVGTSVITVTYQKKTTTFTVAVTKENGYVTQNLAGYYDLTKYENGYTGDINDLSGNNMTMKISVNDTGVEYNPYKADRVGFVDGKFMSNIYNNVGNGVNKYSALLYIPNNSVFTTYPFTVELYAHLRINYPNDGDMVYSTANRYTASYQGVIMDTQVSPSTASGQGLLLNAIDSKLEIKGNTNSPYIVSSTIDDFQIDGNTDATSTNKYHHIIASFGENQQVLYVDGNKVIDNTATSIPINSSTRDMYFFNNSLKADIKLIRVYKNKIFTENEASRNYNDVLDTMGGNN